jgi:hypothetical protein
LTNESAEPANDAEIQVTDLGPPVSYTKPSDVDPDKVRYRLALVLAVTFLATIGVGFWGAMRGTTTWNNVKEWLQAVLPAVTAVVSTAVGFYFGTQQK